MVKLKQIFCLDKSRLIMMQLRVAPLPFGLSIWGFFFHVLMAITWHELPTVEVGYLLCSFPSTVQHIMCY